MLRRFLLSIAIAIACCGLSPPLSAQSHDVDALNDKVQKLYVAGDFPQAIEVGERALKLGEETLGPDHLSVATARQNLAELYRATGRYAEAEPMMLRALAVRERALGPNASEVGLTLNNLAGIYVDQGRYPEAEKTLQRAVEVQKRSLPPGDPAIGRSLNNLAQLYQVLGRYREARGHYWEALAIFDRGPGSASRTLGVVLNNLAQLYQVEGRYFEAEPLMKRALAIYTVLGGADHQSVGVALCSLAGLYAEQGRYAESEALNERGIAILENVLGPWHPIVGTALNNVGELYRSQGRDAKAEPIYLRSLSIRRRSLGPVHADVAQSLNNLAGLYQALGRYEESEQYFKRAIDIFQRSLGSDSLEAAKALNNLAELYRSLHRYAEAEPLYNRSIKIFEAKFGPEHENLGVLISNMAGLYGTQQRYAEAEPLYKRTIAIFEKAKGPNHPYVGQALGHLADFYRQLGRTEEEAVLRKRLAGMPPQGTRHVPLFFVTNREKSETTFGGKLSKTTTLGRLIMRVPAGEVKNRAQRIGENLGLLETATTGKLTAARDLELVRTDRLDTPDAFANAVRNSQRRSILFRNQALVFVHGYNNTFEGAMKRATQVSFDLQFDGILIPFTWPSQGEVAEYPKDDAMAADSVDGFVAFLDDLSRTMPDIKIHLLAHSMGNQVMLRALCKIAKRPWEQGAGHYNFGQVISAHADVSYDDYEKLTACFKDRVEGITLYVNEGDTALSLRCGFARCRAGNLARGYSSVDVVDTTAMAKGFWGSLARGFDHDVFVRNPLLFADITRLLLTGQRPVDARTPEFRPQEDDDGNPYWVYDKTFDPAQQTASASDN